MYKKPKKFIDIVCVQFKDKNKIIQNSGIVVKQILKDRSIIYLLLFKFSDSKLSDSVSGTNGYVQREMTSRLIKS